MVYTIAATRFCALYGCSAQNNQRRAESRMDWCFQTVVRCLGNRALLAADRPWLCLQHTFRYDESASLYRHTFVPFLMGIIDVECYEVYSQLLEKLGDLVDFFTSGNKSLSDVVNLCVHDAHQGALKACKRKIPDVRNGSKRSPMDVRDCGTCVNCSARCYYHLAKNLKDNRRRFGDDALLVKRVIWRREFQCCLRFHPR